MKRNIGLLMLVAAALLFTFSACTAGPAPSVTFASPTPGPGETSVETSAEPAVTAINKTEEPTPTQAVTESYELYLGDWISADTAKTYGEVYEQGGSAIQFTEITGNRVVGNIISVSESSGHRDARVDFNGEIENGVLAFEFDNDGWNSTGTITIKFADDRLQVNMVSNISEDNTTGWSIGSGDYEYVPEGL